MFRGLILPYSYTKGNPIALTQSFNTNSKYELKNDEVLLKSAGLNNIDATIIIESTGDTVLTCTMKVNGQAYSTVAFTVESTSTYTFSFSEVVVTQNSSDNDYVSISFEFDEDCTISSGSVFVEYSE